MKKLATMCIVLVLISGLCVSCGKAEKPELETDKAPVAGAKKWEPETAKKPEVHDEHDGEDHSGHDH